ncbi:MAG: putative 3-hydroxyphenylpropionic transporter MhpT [Candidatus Izimaplasma bacterium HR2]|nr:MAG: putative 3-hydroxyphenylpropionic transporter MhpT [Candidatus Izimaplasma bacterium HR2]
MKKSIIIILSFYFLQGIIHNIGHPVTPSLVIEMGIPYYMFGVFFATMSFGLMLGGPIWGTLGDHGHKRRYIVVGLLVYSFGQYMFGNVGNVYWMVFFRFVSGFGVAASAALLISILICESDKDNRIKYIGWSVAAFTIGGSFGYLIGGKLGDLDYFTNILEPNLYGNIFLIQAILNTILAIYMYFGLSNIKQVNNGDKKPSLIQGFKDIPKLNPTLIIFLISLSFISIGMINVSKYIDIYLIDLGYTTGELGVFVMYTGFVSLLTSIIIVPFVAKIKKDMTIMIYIQVISSIIIFYVFRSNELMLVLYSIFMLYVIMKAVYGPLEQSYISSHASEGKYGTIMGVRQSFFAIGLIIGPLIGGFLYDFKPTYVFDFSVLMFVLGGILLLLVNGRIKKENNGQSV